MKKLYVGNLANSTQVEGLQNFFADFGPLASCTIITDKFTGQSRGFGFVEIEDDARAADAISQLNDQELDGRQLKINEARPREEGGSRGGPRRDGGGRGFGGGGFGGGGRGGPRRDGGGGRGEYRGGGGRGGPRRDGGGRDGGGGFGR